MRDANIKKEVSESNNQCFGVRIVTWEERMQWPVLDLDTCFSEFSGTRVKRVPIITIFGPTQDGQSVCLHIHKVFPYFYVPFPLTSGKVTEFLRTFGMELESALNSESKIETQRVFNLQIVFAKSVYGYREEDELFVKIILYNPRDVNKAANVLLSGAIMGTKFQPFEAHVPFFLQFKSSIATRGLQSTGEMDFTWQDLFRRSIIALLFLEAGNKRNSTTSTETATPYRGKRLERLSFCDIEVDATANDITNIQKLEWRSINEVDENTKLVQSLIPIWKMLCKPNENRMEIDRIFKGDLSSHVNGIRQLIKDIQNQYISKQQTKNSLKRSRSCSSFPDITESARSSVLAANVLSDKQSACVCPSPLQEEELEDEELPEEQDCLTQSPINEVEDNFGMLIELADIAEEEQDIHDILTSIEGHTSQTQPTSTSMTLNSDEKADIDMNIEDHVGKQTTEMDNRVNDDSDNHSEETKTTSQLVCAPHNRPPSQLEVESNLEQCITQQSNRAPFHGLNSDGIFSTRAWSQIPPFTDTNPVWDRLQLKFQKSVNKRTSFKQENEYWIWATCCAPPSVQEASNWLKSNQHEEDSDSQMHQDEAPYGDRPDSPDYDETFSFYHTPRSMRALSSQKIPGLHHTPTRNHKLSGFESLSDLTGVTEGAPSSHQLGRFETSVDTIHSNQQLVICCVEIHAASRGDLLSNPEYDTVHLIIIDAVMDSSCQERHIKVLIFHPTAMQIEHRWQSLNGMENVQIEFYATEKELVLRFIQEILVLDPDIVVGFDLVKSSLGYLTERAFFMEIDLLNEISRMPVRKSVNSLGMTPSRDPATVLIRSPGRILLNLWRVLQSEIKLAIYTFENCVAEVLKIRVPKIEQQTLHSWFSSSSPIEFDRSLRYFVHRSDNVLSILVELDLIYRTSEMARLYGIDFYSVLTRGSQYRVESMLIRLAHSQNYLMISPSQQQVYDQPAMECLPLVLEPKSEVHCDPVVVLDFQSLYPSLVIAYNLCFTTICSKNVPRSDQIVHLGVSEYFIQQSLLDGRIPSEELVITPNGMCFVPASIKQGILPRLLREILETRILIKNQMKTTDPNTKALMRSLNARQYGLKMIANVSYGYSAAGFSGRMPMAELADSIVQSGRQTLMNAIEMIQSHPQWNAEVIYGDSIAEGTPMILKISGKITILEIQELAEFADNCWMEYSSTKEICGLNGVETWTEVGWTKVQSIIRHKWDPRVPLVEVETHLGSVVCTQDHSLVLADGQATQPREINKGTLLLASMARLETSSDNLDQCSNDFHARLLGMYVSTWNREIDVLDRTTKRILCFAYSEKRWLIEEYLDLVKQGFSGIYWSIGSVRFGYILIMKNPEECNAKEFINYVKFHTLDQYGKARVPDFIFNSSLQTRYSFWKGFQEGQTNKNQFELCNTKNARLALGITFLASSLGYTPLMSNGCIYIKYFEYTPEARVIRMKTVYQNGGFVYDLSTTNHHFQAGTGSLIVHNTDSVFVKLHGCSRIKAFEIGNEIAASITLSNPAPIELKMEKVYHPCVLLTKKHYIGSSYTSPDQTHPILDSKGIETIRRDSCPAVAKILEKTLTLLFEKKDLTQIQSYLEHQWGKIMTGRVNLKDFVFSKEVRVGRYRSKVLPPAAVVAAEAQRKDPRRAPQSGERIPYLVIYGHPGQRLVDLVIEPKQLIHSRSSLKLNALYYIKNQINPAVDRVLSLCGVSVENWFLSMPRSVRKMQFQWKPQRTIDSYFLSRHCPICDDVTTESGVLCSKCKMDRQKTMGVVLTKLNRLQSRLADVESVCRHCMSSPTTHVCHSLDCCLYFDRIKLNDDSETTHRLYIQISELF
eukprot:g1914.t1